MGRVLFALFLIVPMIEIGLFISLGQTLGLWPTLLGVVVTAVVGSAILKVQGLSLFAELRQTAQAGQMPARQIAEGLMLAIAGALLLTPGYFTDFVGFLLLVPPIRVALYERAKSKIHVVTTRSGPQTPPRDPNVVDLDPDDWHGDGR